MRQTIQLVRLLCVPLLMSGCGVLPSFSDDKAEHLINREGVDVVAADAGRQLALFKDKGASERFCLAPKPDFSRTAGSQVSGGLPTAGGGALGLGSNISRGALDLGGRDPALLIAREMLYRACELSTNIGADPVTEREIYSQFLAVIVEIAKSRSTAGSAPLASEPSPPLPVVVIPNQSRVRKQDSRDKNPNDYDPDD